MSKKILGFYISNQNESYVDQEFYKIASESSIELEKVNSEDSRIVYYNITRFPTFIALKNNAVASRIIGKFAGDEVLKWARNFF